MKVAFFAVCLFVFMLPGGAVGQVFDTGIRPAAEVTGKYLPLLRGKKIALIVNQASRVGDRLLPDFLINSGINVTRIFVPEHGFRGTADAGAHIDNGLDSATRLPIVSLYGSHKKPTAADLGDVDILLYDLQDVGVRFYTYVSTLQYCMEACAEQKKAFIVLDRPNPNGFYVDGPVLDTAHRSFVGMQPVPVVYGLTPGEYAQMLKGEGWFHAASKLKLTVIKCVGYDHTKKYKLPIAPSPNLRTMAAVYAYPSLCLFEGTPVSVGRGTQLPFQQFGSPEYKGVYSYHFMPLPGIGATDPLFKSKDCYGVLIGGEPLDILKQVNGQFQIKWLIEAYRNHPDKEHFFSPFFLKLAGTDHLKQQVIAGTNEQTIRESWKKELEQYTKIRKKYLLYRDFKKS